MPEFTNKMVLLHPNGIIEEVELASNDTDRLKQMQDAVGGWIEGIFTRDNVMMLGNEEGAIKGLTPNYPATEFLRSSGVQVNMMGGMLFGTVILVGNDGGPETLGVPQDLLDYFHGVE